MVDCGFCGRVHPVSKDWLDELYYEAEAIGPDGMKLGEWSSYHDDYLKSSAWRALREQALSRDRLTCVDCGAKATEVHHRYYPEHVDQTSVDDLVSLCRPCHQIRPRTGTPMTYEERREMTGASDDEDDCF